MSPRIAEQFSVEGKVALVTGGSKGLGKAMARALALAGADVLIVSRQERELEAALAEILSGAGRQGAHLAADLALRSEAERVAQWALSRFGAIDILVNNAGGNFPERVEEITDEAWDHVLGVHVSSAMALTRALAPGMVERGWGRVIYVSSVLGFQGMEGRSAYSTAKSALQGLARSNAVDLGPHGITVNCLAPGAFDTGALNKLTPEQRRAVDGRAALLRRAQPDELAGPILLLASDAGSYISGTTLVVDGGWLAK